MAAEAELDRIIFFSDGVFAIAIRYGGAAADEGAFA